MTISNCETCEYRSYRDETTHCYMFKIPPDEICYQHKIPKNMRHDAALIDWQHALKIILKELK